MACLIGKVFFRRNKLYAVLEVISGGIILFIIYSPRRKAMGKEERGRMGRSSCPGERQVLAQREDWTHLTC